VVSRCYTSCQVTPSAARSTKGPILASANEVAVRTSEPQKLRALSRLRELAGAREILENLIRKEVRVKYKSSVLGVAWSMLNPLLYLVVFSLVFTVVLPNRIPRFPVYLLSGLLAWGLFSNSLGQAVKSVVDAGNLVNKVYFPREVLPLASVGAALVDFAFQSLMLLAIMLLLRYGFWGANLLLLPLSFFALLVLTTAVGLFVSALNVRYRDTQHLLTVGLFLWFWLTPIVYPSGFLSERLASVHVLGVSAYHLVLANPMTGIVMGFQRALYGVVAPPGSDAPVLLPVSLEWLATLVGAVAVGSLLLLWLAWRSFFRMSGDFAEEL
jgi:ABC-2 type transport system permease protein